MNTSQLLNFIRYYKRYKNISDLRVILETMPMVNQIKGKEDCELSFYFLSSAYTRGMQFLPCLYTDSNINVVLQYWWYQTFRLWKLVLICFFQVSRLACIYLSFLFIGSVVNFWSKWCNLLLDVFIVKYPLRRLEDIEWHCVILFLVVLSCTIAV